MPSRSIWGHTWATVREYTTRYGAIVFWILINNIIFWTTYLKYKKKPEYFYLRTILGQGLCVARGSAAVLNMNCGLVLLPVCRSLNSWLHQTLGRFSRYLLIHWFIHLKTIHISIAVTIVISSVIHSCSHVMNAINFSRNHYSPIPEINWASYKGQSPVLLILTSVVGVTGVTMLFLLTLIVLLSLKCVREVDYDLFWGSHFLFFIFLLLYIFHPIRKVLKKQINFKEHIPGCEMRDGNSSETFPGFAHPEPTYGNPGVCVEKPVFDYMTTQAWLWVSGPLMIYLVDLVLRMRCRNSDVFSMTSAITLPDGVTRLVLTSITNRPFIAAPGQYILLQCPSIAPLEWHPFSVVSSQINSSQVTICLLVRIKGDWTRAVCTSHLAKPKRSSLVYSQRCLRLLVDGPFFSPIEGVLRDPTAICIAGGIGITPFAALLNHILKEDIKKMCRPYKLHLVWVIRMTTQLSWFKNLLVSLDDKLLRQKQLERLDLQLYVTREENANSDDWTQNLHILLKNINYNRPSWNDLFREWQVFYERSTVPVYICGPQPMTREVKDVCNSLNKKGSGCRFRCISENFS